MGGFCSGDMPSVVGKFKCCFFLNLKFVVDPIYMLLNTLSVIDLPYLSGKLCI